MAGMMTAAAVTAAGMTAVSMLVIVVVASDVGVIAEITRKQCLDSRVAGAYDTAKQTNACLRESHLRTAANTTADQNISIQTCKDGSKRTMSLSVRVYHSGGNDLSILNVVNLERLGVTEMLKDLFVFISNCNSHNNSPFLYKIICCPHESACTFGIYWRINSSCASPVQ